MAAAFQPNSDSYVRKLDRMQGAVRSLLLGIGEDVQRQGLLDTPKVSGRFGGTLQNVARIVANLAYCCTQRVAKAMIAMTEGYRQESGR
jgi:GTP cyclohydrolase I